MDQSDRQSRHGAELLRGCVEEELDSFQERLESYLPSLTKSQQRIASYLLASYDEAACLSAFAGFDAAQQDCVEGELDAFESDGMQNHCTRATGSGPCS